jgi:N-dimethylarginine dimethylaminohydrolase
MRPPQQPLPAAYGGDGWTARERTTLEEMGELWGDWGAQSEWAPLRAVLLHRPGEELQSGNDPNAVQMLAPVDAALAAEQHEALADAYRGAGIAVHALDPQGTPPPNTLFLADLFFMTPEGAVLARPASSVRAGEERFAAERLAALGVPILHSVHGDATFEGADALWLDSRTVMLATGLRTNEAGARQVAGVLDELGVEVVRVDLPLGAMHLMGSLRLLGPRLAIVWPEKLSPPALRCLEERDFRVLTLPSEEEGRRMGMNGVALGPKRFLIPAGCAGVQELLEENGVACITVEIGELCKAAGGVGCMTGILKREQAPLSPET